MERIILSIKRNQMRSSQRTPVIDLPTTTYQSWRTQENVKVQPVPASVQRPVRQHRPTSSSSTAASSGPNSVVEITIENPQQLPPSSAYMRLARHYQIESSLFERMILNDVYSRQRGLNHSTKHVYPLEYTTEELPAVRGVVDNLFISTTEGLQLSEDDSWSYTAQMTLQLANYLMQQEYQHDDVIILTAYQGQMTYMENQRSFYNNLSTVKISVLEQYDGEETKIIIVSLPLVKNAPNDETVFLAMENKLINAISKAKEGFYLFGNIDILKNKSPLWRHIDTTLLKKGSVGLGLKLKCPNHGFQITAMQFVTDFSKVPEGGCLRGCRYKLPCGHVCPLVCHAYDVAHSNIKCRMPCERKICEREGHQCQLPCSEECEPCERPTRKCLPCGHYLVVPCHYEIGDPRIYCKGSMTVTLPDCGHKAEKSCSMKISEVKCTAKCENNRLDCGHSCLLSCHVNVDPDHETYVCEKPCSKAKRGCSAKLEGELGQHKCPKLCHEECPDCDVQVIKISLKSDCRHPRRVQCHARADKVPCREKCERRLPCGHPCRKLCCEPCGSCQFMMMKKMPGCQHEIEVACYVDTTRQQCLHKCERTLGCGHECSGLCNQPCEVIRCTKVVDRYFDSPCGHRVKLPCHTLGAGGLKPDILLSHCEAPCGAVLRCGHTCGGTCAACRQGRLHVACAAACHNVNMCGHRCLLPVPSVEFYKIPRLKHHLQVSEPECCRACEHVQCSRACGAACDCAPCVRACRMLQACGHSCRGVCGEPCPKACNICDPDNFPTDLTGHPYDDDVKLIQLQDCRHILDMVTLDNFMRSESENIQIKGCPLCRQPIVNTHRYKDIINSMIKNDLNPIKEKIYGTENLRKLEIRMLVFKARRIEVEQKIVTAHKLWASALQLILTAIENKKTPLRDLMTTHTSLQILENLGEQYTKFRQNALRQLNAEIDAQFNIICKVLADNRKMSRQQQMDVANEFQRLNYMIQLAIILDHASYMSSRNTPEVAEAAQLANDAVLGWSEFDEGRAVQRLHKLQDAVRLSGIVGNAERDRVVKAMKLDQRKHWYKCENGHFYCVGEKARALQKGKCIDCGVVVGQNTDQRVNDW